MLIVNNFLFLSIWQSAFCFCKTYQCFNSSKTVFPSYDLKIQENGDPRLNYWCKLIAVDLIAQKEVGIESVHWKPVGPFVTFSASVADGKHKGNCFVEQFTNVSHREFQIMFYSDLGSKTENTTLLCSFSEIFFKKSPLIILLACPVSCV